MGGTDNFNRARGRELALLTACHLESYSASERAEAYPVLWDNPPGVEGADAEVQGLLGEPAVRAFAADLVDLLVEHGAELDELINETSERWRVERMDRVDRNLLRLVATELRHLPDTPRGVILSESVRLAGRYGSERSATFVNGLAEGLARRIRATEPATGS